jgi:hypothetical protein
MPKPSQHLETRTDAAGGPGAMAHPEFLEKSTLIGPEEPNLLFVRCTSAPHPHRPQRISGSTPFRRHPSPLLPLGPRLARRCGSVRPPPLLSPPLRPCSRSASARLLRLGRRGAVVRLTRYSHRQPLPPLDSGPLRVDLLLAAWLLSICENLVGCELVKPYSVCNYVTVKISLIC